MLLPTVALGLGLASSLNNPTWPREKIALPVLTCYTSQPIEGMNFLLRIESVMIYDRSNPRANTPQLVASFLENRFEGEVLLSAELVWNFGATASGDARAYSGAHMDLIVGERQVRLGGKMPSLLVVRLQEGVLRLPLLCYATEH